MRKTEDLARNCEGLQGFGTWLYYWMLLYVLTRYSKFCQLRKTNSPLVMLYNRFLFDVHDCDFPGPLSRLKEGFRPISTPFLRYVELMTKISPSVTLAQLAAYISKNLSIPLAFSIFPKK
ncbi:uncharacterized protein Bfra_003537 [Botrytis fragariae]|uniref:Uncharacterized protein n=1 Tax=Botrytis fragariae TaxID=1964551 RepID=A0A8H6AWX0_9HELO|nr:uncharacterized protein Bfra_003537 [Botrytis fragariae]KAF5875083.1 hypothetical protein Bfra_003537 [Botrytis fragariae]